MAITQYFETTLLDAEADLSAGVLVVPTRSFRDAGFASSPEDLIGALGMGIIGQIEPGWLVRSVATILAYPHDVEAVSDLPVAIRGDFSSNIPTVSAQHYRFAEYLTMARVVPFENSPLSAESIGNIVSASGVGLGAYAGFVVAGGTPLIFVLVPAGMLLFGASAGLAQALEQGMRERVLDFIRKK